MKDGVLEACHFLGDRRLIVRPAYHRDSACLPRTKPRAQLSCLLVVLNSSSLQPL
ncbi:unnamed protein product [Dibothriocephalus latus]|uniref:Uncharacterized protein n=1 Tax=Dibothriocephalus latus TaxID=60516 RepID=A0A3P7MFU1_DIBLA|nr:unnamed protein product [Dibothriocephalus latus]